MLIPVISLAGIHNTTMATSPHISDSELLEFGIANELMKCHIKKNVKLNLNVARN